MGRRLSTSTSPAQAEEDLRLPRNTVDEYGDPIAEHKDPLAKTARAGRSRARKDTRRWCKGKEGVEHTLEIVPDESMSWSKQDCGWREQWWRVRRGAVRVAKWDWYCRHIEKCTKCGKKFRHGWDLGAEGCPSHVEGSAPPELT